MCVFWWTVMLHGLLCLQTIDMELRKLEVLQATSHVKMLLSFMPDAFLGRGGESLQWLTVVSLYSQTHS